MNSDIQPFANTIRVAENGFGHGVVATRALAAGEIAFSFTGTTAAFGEIQPLDIRYAIWLDAETWMIPDAPGRFLNHSCEPNCIIDDDPAKSGDIVVRSTRPVAAGQELTIGYDVVDEVETVAQAGNPLYSFWHPEWTFDCRCGAPACRGRIDGYWLRTTGGTLRKAPRRDTQARLPDGLILAEAPGKGRDVFTTRAFRTGETLEIAPIIVLPRDQWHHFETTRLYNYCYSWGPELQHAAVALGYGSLYNHARPPAARFLRHLDSETIEYIAARPIPAGEEVTIDYTSSYGESVELWFSVVD